MRVNNGIALIMINITQGKELQQATLPRPRLADDIDVARAIAPQHTKLVIDPPKVGQTKGRDLLVVSYMTSEDRQTVGRFGSFITCPNDIGRLNIGMWQVKDTRHLLNIEQKAAVSKETQLIAVEVFLAEAIVTHGEAIKVGTVILLEGTDDCLHTQPRISGAIAKICNANLNLVTQLSSLFFGLGDAGFVAIGELRYCRHVAFRWLPQRHEELAKPPRLGVKCVAKEPTAAHALDPRIGCFVPVICHRAY